MIYTCNITNGGNGMGELFIDDGDPNNNPWAVIRGAANSAGSWFGGAPHTFWTCYVAWTNYRLYRTVTVFDISGVVGTVKQVTFRISAMCGVPGSGRDGTIVICDTIAGFDIANPNAKSNYSKCGTTSFGAQLVNAAAFTIYEIALNASGIAWVNSAVTGGTGKVAFMLRDIWDFNNDDPAGHAPDDHYTNIRNEAVPPCCATQLLIDAGAPKVHGHSASKLISAGALI